jgi:malonyl-CoA decarboxylase
MEAARRLKQIRMILHPDLLAGCLAMRPYSVGMSASTGLHNILSTTFADIDRNLITSEMKCRNLIVYYNNLPQEQRAGFLCELAKDFGTQKEVVMSVAHSIIAAKDKGEAQLLAASDRLRSTLRPKYKTLFSHLGRSQGGVKFLVDLRAEILNLKQSCTDELNGALYQELNSTLRELLMLWFTVGFLNLERITWSSPCDLVQKVSNYEAVHKIRTWEDIKRRVGTYRRCYIFTHNSMPREPVVVLHTALTNEISSSIHSIIQNSRFKPSLSSPDASDTLSDFYTKDAPSPSVPPTIPTSSISFTALSSPFGEEEKEDVSQISCAVFYSITSTQKGLQGIEMGNYLIKTVVRRLQEEFPHLQQFSSLSPIPGFRDWLLSTISLYINMKNAGEEPSVPLLLPEELSQLAPYQQAGQHSPLDTFRDLIQTHKWYQNQALTHVTSGPLLRLCAHYLYVQKRRSYALNPVANFHLSNGAVLWRINFLADTSPRGLMQSCSLMVNYRYNVESTEVNSRNYLENHQIIASPAVLDLLR